MLIFWTGEQMTDKPRATPFDALHKSLVLETTSYFGRGESEHEIDRGVSRADVWFEPSKDLAARDKCPEAFVLWREIAKGRCLIECFSTTPNLCRMTDVVTRLLCKERSLRLDPDSFAPVSLFVFSPGHPTGALAEWGGRPHTQSPWPNTGVHRLCVPDALSVTVLTLSRLPRTRATLLFRLLGRGEVQRLALLELAELHESWTVNIKDILIRRNVMVTSPHIEHTEADREFADNLEAVAQKFVDDIRREGQQIGKAEGKAEGRLSLLSHQLQLRLQRPLTDAELDVVRQLNVESDPALLAEKVLVLSRDELESWLAQDGEADEA